MAISALGIRASDISTPAGTSPEHRHPQFDQRSGANVVKSVNWCSGQPEAYRRWNQRYIVNEMPRRTFAPKSPLSGAFACACSGQAGAQADFVQLISMRSGMVKNECTAWWSRCRLTPSKAACARPAILRIDVSGWGSLA